MSNKIEFTKFDVESLPDDLAGYVGQIHSLESKLAACKATFAKRFAEVAEAEGGELSPPEGMQFVFGFRFGGLAVGYAPVKSPKSGTSVGFSGKAAKPARTRSKSLKGALKPE